MCRLLIIYHIQKVWLTDNRNLKKTRANTLWGANAAVLVNPDIQVNGICVLNEATALNKDNVNNTAQKVGVHSLMYSIMET